MEELKGGIVIIGSLFWQDDSVFGNGDGERKKWRDNYLEMDNAIRILFPLYYGRISEGKETTMTICGEKDGAAYFVPFKKISDNLSIKNDIRDNAMASAIGEGWKNRGKIKKKKESVNNFSCSWLIIGKLINIKSINNETINAIEEEWKKHIIELPKQELGLSLYDKNRRPFIRVSNYNQRNIYSYNDKTTYSYYVAIDKVETKINNKTFLIQPYEAVPKDDLSYTEASINSTNKEFCKKNSFYLDGVWDSDDKDVIDTIPLERYGNINFKGWLKATNVSQQHNLDKYSYTIACFLPPSFEKINDNIENQKYQKSTVKLEFDKNRFYFFNNLACGIRTADDFETILNNKTGIIKKFKGNEFKLYNEEYVNIKYQNSFNKLIFQKNNLYLVNVKNDLIFWQTNNKTKRGSYIIFQDDGNLVIYDENEKPNWATDTKSESIKEIQFLYDSIEFYNSNEVVVDKLNVNKSEKFLITKNEEFKYNSGKISIIKEELFNNLTLNQGEFIECGMAKLIFDTKGRLLLYHNDTLVWFTKMINGHHKDDESQNGYGGKNAKFQDDGNLVIYSDDGKPTWCSKEIVKDTHIKHYLKLSSDGNLSIIDYKSNKIWSATHFKIGIAQKQYINYTARPNILSMLYDMYPNNVLEHYIPNLVDKSSFHEKMCAMPINSIYLHSSTEAIFNNNDELMHYNLSENKIVNKHDKKTAKAGDGYTPKIFKNKNDKIEYTDEL